MYNHFNTVWKETRLEMHITPFQLRILFRNNNNRMKPIPKKLSTYAVRYAMLCYVTFIATARS